MTYIGFDHHISGRRSQRSTIRKNLNREMRVLNDSSSLKGFLKGLPQPFDGSGRSWTDVRSDSGVARPGGLFSRPTCDRDERALKH
jgi:hypothetical protein